MIPCLYNYDETEYTTNGIGKLADAISCVVTEKRNSSYELVMEYPADGIHADSLIEGNIILAKPADNKAPQPFRIYSVTTPLDGKLEVSARHISYLLNYITVSPLGVLTGDQDMAQAALDALKENATTDCPFSFETDIESDENFTVSAPNSIRNCLGGIDGSVLDTYGGEYEWDFYTVRLHESRGADNGVRIVYGKNLVDFKMEKSIENTITGVHPYWRDADSGDIVELPEKIVELAEPAIGFRKIMVLDCSEQFEAEPTEEQLRSYAESYLEDSSYVEPDIDIDIDFLQLWQLPGYEDIAEAERVSLCDTVHVYIVKLGVEVSARVTETQYDSLLERYNSITLSNSVTSSRSTSLVTSLLTASQAKAMISMTESAIRLSVANTYVTSDTLEEGYSTTVETQALINETAEAITLAFTETLTSYSTTEETKALIEESAEGITLSFSNTLTETLEDYSTTEETKALIEESASGITLSFTQTLSETLADYSTTEEINSLIQASADAITLSFNQTLTSYSTTEEIETLISESASAITLSFTTTLTETLEDYSTTEETKALIEESASGITLSFTQTLTDTLADYSTTEEINSLIQASADAITLSFNQRLTSYSTTEEIETLISESASAVTLSFTTTLAETLEDYSTTEETKALIEESVSGITLSFTQTLTDTLADYSTTEEVASMIQLSEDGITLSVSNTLADYTKTSEVRSQFALDSSSVTIDTGVITFSSNSITIDSDNFQLSESGEVSATGSFTSGDDDGFQFILSNSQLTGYNDGESIGYISLHAGSHRVVDDESYDYSGITVHADDILLSATMLSLKADMIAVNYDSSEFYDGCTGTLTVVTAIEQDDDGTISYSRRRVKFYQGIMITEV